jgi:dipeptidase E
MSNNICSEFTIALAGGGDPDQSIALDELFVSCMQRRRMLFVPHAVAPHEWSFDRALAWLMESPAFRRVDVTILKDDNAADIDLSMYGAVYLMGGSVYKLLDFLQRNNWFETLKTFLENDGLVYGISAGAMVLGHDISTAPIGPEGETDNIGLSSLAGMNMISGYDFYPHYRSDEDRALLDHVRKTGRKCLAASETGGLYVRTNQAVVVGDDMYVFAESGKRMVSKGSVMSVEEM